MLELPPHQPRRPSSSEVEATLGLVVEDVETGWCGAIIRVEKAGGQRVVHLEDRHGRSRGFPLGPGFWLDGQPVILVPAKAELRAPQRTASGSRAVTGHRAQVAKASRIWVEGKHDAELVERVWGADLRLAGVVVELLGGIDDLALAVHDFAPGPGRRLGVLVDHLVPGSKESRIVAAATAGPGLAEHLLVVGHPYVDVWQSIRPQRLGLRAWPVIDRSREWKYGVLEHLGWPAADQADVARGWQKMLGTVRSYTDLQPELLSRVEHLIDFVTAA